MPYSHEWGGQFQFVDDDELIFKEVILPDNSCEYVTSEEEKQDLITQWLLNHPDYVKSEYGTFYRIEKAPTSNYYEEDDTDEDIDSSAEAGNATEI